MNFLELRNAIGAQFELMQKHPLFRVSLTGSSRESSDDTGEDTEKERDILWNAYLAAFPAGTDPIYRKRTQHDCSCCRGFIRKIGAVVAIIDGKVVSVWDIKLPKEPTYEVVAKAMSDLVKSAPIVEPFLHYEAPIGATRTFERLTNGEQQGWNHFHATLKSSFVMKQALIPTELGHKRATQAVFMKSLSTITMEAINTLLELIGQNSIYRGKEFIHQVTEFKKLKSKFDALGNDTSKELFSWKESVAGHSDSVLRIANKAIGTLLEDLSTDMELEDAVKKFEVSVMAPSNYKRPTALVSKKQIEEAKKTIESLDLGSALERRYATLADVPVDQVLFVDRNARKKIGGNALDELLDETSDRVKKADKWLDKIEEVGLDRFLSEVVPKADTLEVLVENKHKANFVSLIAPAHPSSKDLFKWNNKLSWSYTGDVTDSIKERVKKAGGNVTGDLCCRLAWNNSDDLDLHMFEPNGNEIFFRGRNSRITGGTLDVDANGMDGPRPDPVENIFYQDRSRMLEGRYKLVVHQYSKRETKNVGFEAQVEFMGEVLTFSHPAALRDGLRVTVAEFTYTHKDGVVLDEKKSLPCGSRSQTVWNIPTQTFHKVNVLMKSPNYWGEQPVGNEHLFFMLEGCKNDGTARGFYNEFLSNELGKHSKVLEMVGAKMQTAKDDNQLSGVGFSTTRENTLVCRVKGSFNRTLKVNFK